MLLAFSVITIIFSIVLAVYNWRVNKTALYLSASFILISIYGLAHYFTIYGKNAFWLAVFYNHVTPLVLLIGPFLFFYIRGTLKDKPGLTYTDLIHFIPATIHLIGMYQWFFIPFKEKLEVATSIIQNADTLRYLHPNTIFSVELAFFLRPALLMLYALYCIRLLWKNASTTTQYDKIPQHQFLITYRWLVVLLVVILMLCVNWLILTTNFIETSFIHTLQKSNYLYGLTGGIFGLMALLLLFFPQVLYGIPHYSNTPRNFTKEDPSDVNIPSIRAKNKQEPFDALVIKIKNYLDTSKSFTNPEFSIEDLAEALDTPLNHISYCLHNVMHTKFTELRMQYRITYAKKLLKEGMRDSHTIEVIAQQSGFSTRSNFYNAFKQVTGLTPTEFVKKQNKNSSQ